MRSGEYIEKKKNFLPDWCGAGRLGRFGRDFTSLFWPEWVPRDACGPCGEFAFRASPNAGFREAQYRKKMFSEGHQQALGLPAFFTPALFAIRVG